MPAKRAYTFSFMFIQILLIRNVELFEYSVSHLLKSELSGPKERVIPITLYLHNHNQRFTLQSFILMISP
ncbi:hypothetical protein AMELA_G00050050 [Ameiurus melas]|uniref:Uncharacterized protein n=1 Tax=Ameiurus melas TaxID=219545 RepID=A0A7J6B5T8_AMEME|nr:hypothetical protein AMELA_G00050050 [Ameiurus melas]